MVLDQPHRRKGTKMTKRALEREIAGLKAVWTRIFLDSMTSFTRTPGAGAGRLPTAKELTGSEPDFTGDLSTEQYLRSIRKPR
jgi:hypothetical protein